MSADNPLAAYLDAQVRAHQAGVTDADVALLAEIGEDIARFAEILHAKFGRLRSGAAGTNTSNPKGPPRHAVELDDPHGIAAMLVGTLQEDSYGYSLDHIDVIWTSAALASRPAQQMSRAA